MAIQCENEDLPIEERPEGFNLVVQRREEGNETCPVCKEAPDLRLALTCVSCRARYHLGCIAESRSRRCVSCQSRVVPQAKLHIERLRRKLSWRPTRIWIMVGTSLTLIAMGVHVRVHGVFFAFYLLIYLALLLKGKWDSKHQEDQRSLLPVPAPVAEVHVAEVFDSEGGEERAIQPAPRAAVHN